MKLNFINKAYILCAALLVLAIGYRVFTYKSWDRYYYFSSISAPETYPVFVREAFFITQDPDDHAWFDNRDVNDFHTAWGTEYLFPEVSRPLRLPEKLVLEYASYRDSKFYIDTLDLPQARIKALFKTAAKNNTMDQIRGQTDDVAALRFVLGIANNGNVILWLREPGLEHVILKTRLTAKEPDGDATYYEKPLSKEGYLRRVFERLNDSLKTELDKGLEAHASYIDSASHYPGNRN